MGRLDEKWALGKIWDSLKNTARTVDTLNELKSGISEEAFEELKYNLRGALIYQVRVVFCLNGVEDFDELDVVENIIDKGEFGLDESLQRYGIIQDSEILRAERARLHREQVERPNFIAKIFELSQKGMTDSRREIYDECENFGKDKLTKEILDSVEDVTQGTKTWSQFQKEITTILKPYLKQVN